MIPELYHYYNDLHSSYYCLDESDTETETITRCEGEQVNLDCLDGMVIRIVTAMYGRQKVIGCWTVDFTKCKSQPSLDAVKKRCEGKQTCHFTATIKMFGDPCPRTNKYIEVKYQCIIKPGIIITLDVLMSGTVFGCGVRKRFFVVFKRVELVKLGI